MLSSGSTDKGALQGAFFRFYSDLLSVRHDQHIAQLVAQLRAGTGNVPGHELGFQIQHGGAPALSEPGHDVFDRSAWRLSGLLESHQLPLVGCQPLTQGGRSAHGTGRNGVGQVVHLALKLRHLLMIHSGSLRSRLQRLHDPAPGFLFHFRRQQSLLDPRQQPGFNVAPLQPQVIRTSFPVNQTAARVVVSVGDDEAGAAVRALQQTGKQVLRSGTITAKGLRLTV